ncbi:MAG: hypothetical protein IPI33_16520 [Dehalococcoidia bacterium]|nr:hypothetical protein [Dehalococcoidia bacterium]
MTMVSPWRSPPASGLLTASGIAIGKEIDGYRIDADPFDDIKRAPHGRSRHQCGSCSVFMGWDPMGRLFGTAGSVAGVLAVVLLAVLLAPPTWGFPWLLPRARWGTVALGAVSVSMVWGTGTHRRRTPIVATPRPGRRPPWRLGLQVAVLAVNLFHPCSRNANASNPIDVEHLRQSGALPPHRSRTGLPIIPESFPTRRPR